MMDHGQVLAFLERQQSMSHPLLENRSTKPKHIAIIILWLPLGIVGCRPAAPPPATLPPIPQAQAPTTAAQAHAPAPSSALLFGDRAELTSATRMIRRPAGGGGQQWEVTKTYNSGRTRISAVRRPGNNVTEYYNSSTGPEGSTARRRVVAKSSNTDR